MDAGSVIDLFQSRFGGHLNRVKLLEEIGHAQNEILALPGVPLMRNKTVEYLATTAGVYQYTVAGKRTVQRIFIRTQGNIPGGYGASLSPWAGGTTGEVTVNGQEYDELDIDFECDEARSPSDTGCTIYLPEDVDPGTTTDVYRLESYRWPTFPSTEAISMELPDPWITSLLSYAIKMKIEESAYGVDIYNDPKFQKLLAQFIGHQARAKAQSTIRRKPRF